jgi:hypothetical protein
VILTNEGRWKWREQHLASISKFIIIIGNNVPSLLAVWPLRVEDFCSVWE